MAHEFVELTEDQKRQMLRDMACTVEKFGPDHPDWFGPLNLRHRSAESQEFGWLPKYGMISYHPRETEDEAWSVLWGYYHREAAAARIIALEAEVAALREKSVPAHVYLVGEDYVGDSFPGGLAYVSRDEAHQRADALRAKNRGVIPVTVAMYEVKS